MSSEQCNQETSDDHQGQAIDEGAHQQGSKQHADAEERGEACGGHSAKPDEDDGCKDQHSAASSAAKNQEHGEHVNCAIWPPGYYYQDSDGNTQGPCSLQDLQSLQACFPEALHMMIWTGDGAQGGFSAQLYEVLHWAAPKQQQQDPRARRSGAASLSSCCNAEATVDAFALPAQCAYAEAVLAGLPEDDEAVQLARLAEASGNTLESVLQFQYKALSRKEADAGAAPDSDPYQDVRSWCPPEEWEAFIADRHKRKDLGQPQRDWKKLKRHRQEIKAKQSATSMEWLRN